MNTAVSARSAWVRLEQLAEVARADPVRLCCALDELAEVLSPGSHPAARGLMQAPHPCKGVTSSLTEEQLCHTGFGAS